MDLAELREIRTQDIEESLSIWTDVYDRMPRIDHDGFDAIFGLLLNDTATYYTLLAKEEPRKPKSVDPLDVALLTALIGDASLEFIFNLFASRGVQATSSAQAMFQCLRDVGVLFGRELPEKKFSGSYHAFWDMLQDDVELASFFDSMFAYRKKPWSIVKIESKKDVSAIMMAQTEEEERERPPLLSGTLKMTRISTFEGRPVDALVATSTTYTVAVEDGILTFADLLASTLRSLSATFKAQGVEVVPSPERTSSRRAMRRSLVDRHRPERPIEELARRVLCDALLEGKLPYRRDPLRADSLPFHLVDSIAMKGPGLLRSKEFLQLLYDTPRLLKTQWFLPIAQLPLRTPKIVDTELTIFDALPHAVVLKDGLFVTDVTFDGFRRFVIATNRDAWNRQDDDESDEADLANELCASLARSLFVAVRRLPTSAITAKLDEPFRDVLPRALANRNFADRIHILDADNRFLGDLLYAELARFVLDTNCTSYANE